MYFNGTGDFIYPVGKGGSRSERGVSIFPISHAESVGVTIRGFQAYDSFWIQWDMAVYITQQYNISLEDYVHWIWI